MTDKKEPVKVEFAPGCFDSFEGTQEELDALQKEILDMFANMTREEIEANSRQVNFDELIEDGDFELLEALSRTTEGRTLQ